MQASVTTNVIDQYLSVLDNPQTVHFTLSREHEQYSPCRTRGDANVEFAGIFRDNGRPTHT
jgi:hypothetical protein